MSPPSRPRAALTWLAGGGGRIGFAPSPQSGSGSGLRAPGGRRAAHWPPALRRAGPGWAAGTPAAPPGPEAAAGRWDPGVGAGQRGAGRLEDKRTAGELANRPAGGEGRGEAGRGERGGEARGRGAPRRGAERRGLGAHCTKEAPVQAARGSGPFVIPDLPGASSGSSAQASLIQVSRWGN